MFTSRKKTLLVVAAAGVCVKLAEFLVWRASTFRFYNFLPGLDMATLLRFGEWGTEGNGFFLTPHRALVAACWALNGHRHFVPGIVAVQALFGILGAVLCADLALKFCRRDRKAAWFCGGFYLLYGPFFIYEFSVLQEAVALNLILLAFHASVSARSFRGFLWAGLTLGLCVVGRPTALFFVPAMLGFMAYREFVRRRPRREAAKRLGAALGGLCAVLCLVSVTNRVFGGNWSCFFNAAPYSLEFNAAAPGATAETKDPYLRTAFNAVERAPRMFLPTEVPENLNYCFLRDRMPLLAVLPGPVVLLPLALAGMILMLPKLRRPAALTLLPLATLVLPLCVRDPIGRYRLTLIPYFILCAGYWFHVLRSRPAARNLPAALSAATFSIALVLPTYRGDLLRSDDYLAYAMAMEHPIGGRPTAESMDLLAEGWKKSGFKNDRLGEALYRRLMVSGDVAGARRVLELGVSRSPDNDVFRCRLAFLLADAGDFAGAERMLAQTTPGKLGGMAGDYHFLCAEMLLRRGAAAGAEAHYRRALTLLEADSAFAIRARQQLAKLVSARDAAGASGTTPPPPAAPSRE